MLDMVVRFPDPQNPPQTVQSMRIHPYLGFITTHL